jgi:hypothetical protein
MTPNFTDDQMKGDEMGRARGIQDTYKKYAQNFGHKTGRKEPPVRRRRRWII